MTFGPSRAKRSRTAAAGIPRHLHVPRLLEGPRQLLGVEGRAVGHAVEPGGEGLAGRRSEDVGELLAGGAQIEALHAHAAGEPLAVEVGEEHLHRGAGVHRVLPASRDQHELERARRAGQEVEEVRRRLVRPVEVVDDEVEGPAACDGRELHLDRLEEARLLRLGRDEVARLGRERVLSGRATRPLVLRERIGEAAVRGGTSGLEGTAQHDGPRLLGNPCALHGQASLAHAALAEEDERARALLHERFEEEERAGAPA